MNNVILKGWIQNPLKLISTQSQKNVFTITVKTSNGKSADGKNTYTFHNVKCFGADKAMLNGQQGDLITVVGHLVSGSYEKDGKTIYTYELVGDDIIVSPNPQQAQPQPQAQQSQGYGYPQGQPQPMQQPNPQGQGYGYPQGQPMQQTQQAQQMQQYPTQRF